MSLDNPLFFKKNNLLEKYKYLLKQVVKRIKVPTKQMR